MFTPRYTPLALAVSFALAAGAAQAAPDADVAREMKQMR